MARVLQEWRILLIALIFATIWPTPERANADVTISVSEQTYSVRGSTAEEVREQIANLGPVDGHDGSKVWAKTDHNINWKFWYRARGTGCEITSVTTDITITYTYPRWNDLEQASTELQRSWHRMIEGLRHHEEHHGQHAVDAGHRIDASIRNMKPRNSCAALEAAANALGHSISEKLKQQNIDYDKRTQHGRTEIPRF